MKKSPILILCLLLISIFAPLQTASAHTELPNDVTLTFSSAFDNQIEVEKIISQACKRMGYQTNFDISGMSSSIITANTGETDGLVAQYEGIGKEYQDLVMVDSYVSEVYFEAFSLDGINYNINKWSDLSGLKVGMFYQKYYIEKNLPADVGEITRYSNWPMLVQGLINNEVDVILMTKTINKEFYIPDGLQMVGVVDSMLSYPYLNKDYAYLAPELAQTIDEMKEDGTFDAICNGTFRQNKTQKNVLMITSYSSEEAWEYDIVQNVKSKLNTETNATFSMFSLNGRRITDGEQRDKNALKSLRTMLYTEDYDAVVISDKYAFDFIQAYYQFLFNGLPIFYCGLEENLENTVITIPSDKITGVTEHVYAKETIGQMLKMFPETKQIYVINEHTKTGRLWHETIEAQCEEFTDRVEFIYNDNITYEELLEEVKALPDNALVLTGAYYLDSSNIYHSQEAFSSTLSKVAAVPVFGLFGPTHGYGNLGGCYNTAQYQGESVGNMVVAYINGKDIPMISVPDSSEAGVWQFDYKVMEKWGISESQLPKNAIITNIPLPLRESDPQSYYSMIIISIVAFVTIIVFIAFYFVIRNRNKKILQKDALIEYTQKEFEKIVDVAPVAIYLFNPSTLKIIYISSFSVQMLGYKSKDDLLGKTIDIFHPSYFKEQQDDKNEIRKNVETVLSSNETQIFSLTVQRNDNKQFEAVIRANYITYNGELCIIAAMIDNSIEVQRNQMLENAAIKEKEANALKSRFLMNMSHEIRTPMNAIIGLSELSMGRYQGEKSSVDFEKINKSSKYLLQIVNDILDFSKIEAEKLDLIYKKFDLEEVIANALIIAKEKIGKKPLQLLIDFPSDLPCELIGDQSRIWQIFKNILDNAAKYTMKGFVKLKLRVKAETPEDVTLTATVVDTGMGMDELQLERLYTPFDQYHDIGKSVGAGTGLGLAITKHLIDLMNATINVDSQVDIGTTFNLEITLPKVKNCRTIEQKLLEYKLESTQNILIIGSDSTHCKYVEKYLDLIHNVNFETIDPKDFNIENSSSMYDNMYDKMIIIVDNKSDNIMKSLVESAISPDKLYFINSQSNSNIISDADFNQANIIESPFVPSELVNQLFSDCKSIDIKYNYKTFPKARVLVCEDNELNQEVAIGCLENFGIKPVVVDNGAQAVAIIRKHEFDLIFMDILMPIMDGHTATRQIRKENLGGNIPIVAMTAHVMKEEIDNCFANGMNGVLNKPLEIGELYKVLRKYLSDYAV